MGATLYPLPIPPRPWHTVGLDYLTHVHVSNGFDSVLIVVENLTRVAFFLLCIESVTAEEIAHLFLKGVYRLHGLPRENAHWSVIATRNSLVAFGKHFGDALERV
jgi:hypothetical protein